MKLSQPGSYATTYDEFERASAAYSVIPIIRRRFVDTLTPVGAFRSLGAGIRGSFLLESASSSGDFGRYSFIGLESFGTLTATADDVPVWSSDVVDAQTMFGPDGLPERNIDALKCLVQRWHAPTNAELPPLTSGLVGHVSWEAIRELERMPQAKAREYPLPLQAFTMVRDLVCFDQRNSTVTMITNVLHPEHSDPTDPAWTQRRWADAQSRLDAIEERLAAPEAARIETVNFDVSVTPRHRTATSDFLDAIETSKQHIRRGDIFQVVIGQRFEVPCTVEPLEVYRVLRALNPSPYMYVINQVDAEGREYSIVGSSPEALVRVGNGHVMTHPIAGSRPRGETLEEDAALADALIADAKERSEHLMLVDLARNDLSRVCTPGSVQVTEFMQVEKFSHIMHIVSSVEGELEGDKDAVDVFAATFPAGTLSGAPKPKAMEIITTLEPSQRGIYGGVVGYFDFTGTADLAIAIRTAVISDGIAYVQAGAGLVADSVPEREDEESRNKAAAPLRAVAIASSIDEESSVVAP